MNFEDKKKKLARNVFNQFGSPAIYECKNSSYNKELMVITKFNTEKNPNDLFSGAFERMDVIEFLYEDIQDPREGDSIHFFNGESFKVNDVKLKNNRIVVRVGVNDA